MVGNIVQKNVGMKGISVVRTKRKLGMICFANNSGLGAQTRRLAEFLQPERVLVINSSGFSQNKKQNFGWYKDFEFFTSNGFPTNDDVKAFIPGLTHIFTCENPYNFNLIYWAEKEGIKTYCQSNYEFCENLMKPYLPVPTKFLMPSYWKIDEMKELFGEDRVMYLPPPINEKEFKKPRRVNLARKGKRRFLHIIGTLVTEDRNGTLDLLKAIKLTKGDFELVIHTQHPLPMTYYVDDSRIKYRLINYPENWQLYDDFDALILPRRFGGLSLTTNEGLLSGLPVIMTNISPNNKLLPKDWLINSNKNGKFFARSEIDLFSVKHDLLAKKIDYLSSVSDDVMIFNKKRAIDIGVKNFDYSNLVDKYHELFKSF